MGKYFPETARHAKAQEFLELKQGATTVMDYVARFMELARFADDTWPPMWPKLGDSRMGGSCPFGAGL